MNRKWALIAAFAVVFSMEASFTKDCYAGKAQPFLDGDPRYPLVYAFPANWKSQSTFNRYLDLESCEVITDDEDGFEISADYIRFYLKDKRDTTTLRFRKNEESDGELQVFSGHFYGGDYREEWSTFYNPYDEETIEQRLDKKGGVNFLLDEYYMFKRVYQHLFGEPYEDDWDDEVLRRSVIILPREGEPGINHHEYLWDDKNYPLIFAHMELARYLDITSVYVEIEDPPQYVLRIIAYNMPRFRPYNDVMPSDILSYRFLYDEDEEKMYLYRRSGEKTYIPPDSGTSSKMARDSGEAAFYLAYGKRFYGAAPRWDRLYKRNVDVFGDGFYERLDGED